MVLIKLRKYNGDGYIKLNVSKKLRNEYINISTIRGSGSIAHYSHEIPLKDGSMYEYRANNAVDVGRLVKRACKKREKRGDINKRLEILENNMAAIMRKLALEN